MADDRWGFDPICAICNLPIRKSPDMHEVLITRGDIQGNRFDLTPMIMVPVNCVLVHPGGGQSKCHQFAHTKKGQEQAVAHLLTWQQQRDIENWLEIMADVMNSGEPERNLRLVREVAMKNTCPICGNQFGKHTDAQIVSCFNKAEVHPVKVSNLKDAIGVARNMLGLKSHGQTGSNKNIMSLTFPKEQLTTERPILDILKRALKDYKKEEEPEPVDQVKEDA